MQKMVMIQIMTLVIYKHLLISSEIKKIYQKKKFKKEKEIKENEIKEKLEKELKEKLEKELKEKLEKELKEKLEKEAEIKELKDKNKELKKQIKILTINQITNSFGKIIIKS